MVFAHMLVSIRKRKQAQEALQESERKARAIFDISFGFIGLLSPDGLLLDANRTALDFAGVSLTEVAGKPFWECPWWTHSPADQELVRTGIRAAAEGRLVRFKTTNRSADGKSRIIDFSLKPVLDDSGHVVLLIPEGRDITEGEQMEEALKRSEEKFAKAFQASPDLIIMTALEDGRILEVNERLQTITGYRRDEVIGRTTSELQLWVDPSQRDRYVAHLLQGGHVHGWDVKLRFKSGKILDTLLSGEVIELQGGKCILGVVRDVTEQRQAQETLRESEEQYRSLFEHMFSAFILVEVILDSVGNPVDHRLLQANAEFDRMTGLKRSEELGRTSAELSIQWPPEVAQSYYRIALGGDPLYWERFNESLQRYYEIVAYSPCKGQFAMIFHDISERKHAEQEISNLKNYLSNIIDSMPSMLVGIDGEGTITQWNHEAQVVTGISLRNAIGQPFYTVLPEFSHWIEPMRVEAVRLNAPSSPEKVVVEKDGNRNFYDLMVYPLMASGGQGTVVRIENVTERTRIQELMIQTEKMMSVGGLAAGMAHEINNPLGIISQAAQNIERRLSTDLPANRTVAEGIGLDLSLLKAYYDQRRIPEFVSGILDAVGRATKIVGNILQFSRKPGSSKVPTSLVYLVEQALELAANDYDLKKKYDFRSIEIQRDFEPDLPLVPVVAIEVEQVILNLMKNAAQAMIENPPERPPALMLRAWTEPRYVVLEAKDNGHGMNESVRRKIFEPFFTTKEPGVGTGLGLSISYIIITQNHKGLMEVDSTPGQGTRFTIRLPLDSENHHG